MKKPYCFVLTALIFSFSVIGGAATAQNRHADYGAVREAIDQREVGSSLLKASIDAGDYEALRLWGLGGSEACPVIRPYLASNDTDTVVAALAGLANCRDTGSFAAVYELAASSGHRTIQTAALKALAFITTELNRRPHSGLVAEVLQSEAPDAMKAVAIYGLMQSITYSGLSPSDLPALDFNLLLDQAATPGPVGMQAAYLLARLAGLSSVYTPDAVMAAIKAGTAPEQQYVLAKLLAQFGDVASPFLIELAASDDPRLAMSALRSLGGLTDAASMALIDQTLSHNNSAYRHLAVTALAARNQGDAAITAKVAILANDANPWVAVTALRGLMQRAPDQAIPIAEAWIAGDDYYRAFVALGMLAQSDDGKAILTDYAAAHPDTIRGREAAIALDPSIEAIRQPRKTPSASLLRSYSSRAIILETTRGAICIEPLPDAPYAAANFMLLADAGKLDGMLWHRVIPNFVTQAGQSEDFSLATWGTIREEWGAPSHEVGTVGVATAGPDTGSAQFFINTAHNLHLDGRYTVFAKVVSGMDVANLLQEGDVIEKASTETVQTAACK